MSAEAAVSPIWTRPLLGHFDQSFMFLPEKRLYVLKAKIKVTISCREEKITENYTGTIFLFRVIDLQEEIQGKVDAVQKDKQGGDFSQFPHIGRGSRKGDRRKFWLLCLISSLS